MKTYLEAVLLWKMSGTKSDALKVCCKVAVRNWMMRGDDFFFDFFCCSVWGSFPCYLLHFGAKISDLHVFCCILELKSLICMLFDLQHCGAKIWNFACYLQHFGAKTANLGS